MILDKENNIMFNKVTNFVVANPAMAKKIGAGIGAAVALLIGGVYLLSKMEDDPEDDFYGPPYDMVEKTEE